MRAIQRFLYSKRVKPTKIIHRIEQQYGESRNNIYEWVDCFKNGRMKRSAWKQCKVS